MLFTVSAANLVRNTILDRQTQHFFPTRKYKHQYAVKCNQKTNGFAQHIHNNKKYTIDWDNQIFLDFESHWRKRKIKEALFIDSINPGKDILPNKLMNIEKGIEISSCWKEFNPHTRKIFFKKIQRSKLKQKNEFSRKEFRICMCNCNIVTC